jgi:Protein of unknown function (DUF1018)
MSQPKNNAQVRAIHGEAKRRGLDGEQLHDLVESTTRRTRSIAALTHAEAQQVIQRLKGNGFVPLRTLQYRRQKAGIPVLVRPDQLTLIAELASQRDWSIETLAAFCKRQCKREVPRTTTDANKVIEALKAMNKREGLWAA